MSILEVQLESFSMEELLTLQKAIELEIFTRNRQAIDDILDAEECIQEEIKKDAQIDL